MDNQRIFVTQNRMQQLEKLNCTVKLTDCFVNWKLSIGSVAVSENIQKQKTHLFAPFTGVQPKYYIGLFRPMYKYWYLQSKFKRISLSFLIYANTFSEVLTKGKVEKLLFLVKKRYRQMSLLPPSKWKVSWWWARNNFMCYIIISFPNLDFCIWVFGVRMTSDFWTCTLEVHWRGGKFSLCRSGCRKEGWKKILWKLILQPGGMSCIH